MKTERTTPWHSAGGGNHSAFRVPPSAFAKASADKSVFSSAFTLLETMIAVSLFSIVIAGSIGVYIMCQKMWHATSLNIDTANMASLAIENMVYGMGTNSGLRSASTIVLSTNFHGWPFTMKYWETGSSPPPAHATTHHICSCGAYPRDGSWRMTVSNAFDGVTYIEYNAPVRSIFFCPVTNLQSNARLTAAAEQRRISICHYVLSSTVNSTNGTVTIQMAVWKKDGIFVSSNQIITFVTMRN